MSIEQRLRKLERQAEPSGEGCALCRGWDWGWAEIEVGDPDPEPERCPRCGRERPMIVAVLSRLPREAAPDSQMVPTAPRDQP